MEILSFGELPISNEIVREHLRVTADECSDELLKIRIETAVGIAEDFTNRSIMQKEVNIEFSELQLIKLPVPAKIISCSLDGEELSKDDYSQTTNTFENTLILHKEGTRLSVKCEIGYTEQTLPPSIKGAILLMIGTLYDNESDNIIGRSVSQISLTAEKILSQWRIRPY